MSEKLQTNNASGDDDFAALFNYPALGRLFDGGGGAPSLVAMRTQLKKTVQQLERVQRQGSPQDAARAERIVQAYQTTLKFLEELENSGQKS